MQLTPVTTPEQRVRALDVSVPLLTISQLDANADGRISQIDATAFEQVAQADRDDAAHAGDAGHGSELLEQARRLDYAGQQARYAAAMVDAGATLAPAQTVHDIVPTPALPQGSGPRDAIAAIGSVDTDALHSFGASTVATFDVDGTSIKGDIFLPFLERMAREQRFDDHANTVFRDALGKLDIDQAQVARNDANANALLLLSKIDPASKTTTPQALSNADGFFVVGDALVGQRMSDLRGVAQRLMEQGVGSIPPYKDRVNDDSTAQGDSVPDVVAALRANNITPHIVTYGFDFLAQAAAPYLGIDADKVIGTHVVTDADGIVTGHDGRTIAPKSELVRRETGTVPLFAFGDSGSDLSMLDLAAARGIVVNPSASMRAAIDERAGALGEVRYASTLGATRAGASA